MAAVSEIHKDIEELLKLEGETSRSRVKDLLNLEIRRLQTELTKLEEMKVLGEGELTTRTSAAAKPQVYKELIKNYAWDQSEKFLKLYMTLQGVHSLAKDAISSQFTGRSVKVEVQGLNGKNCELQISKLAEEIDPDGSYYKVKKDMVLVMLKKHQPGKTWACVTQQEKQAKEFKKPPPPAKDEDPGASLMSMLQNMYEDGDDEMKRTLKKAMYESQQKKNSMM